MEIKNILFICKHNAFRSKIAENYFNQINKNKNVVAMSSGVFPAKLADLPLGLMKKFGFKIITPPRPTTPDILKNQDLVIIVADDIPKDLFNHNQKFYGFLKDKVIFWDIRDTDERLDENNINSIIKQIMEKVDELNEKLETGKIKL